MSRWARAALILCLAGGMQMAVRAEAGSPRAEIQAAYDRYEEALENKFLDGILSLRTREYAVYTPGGQQLPPKRERANLVRLLRSATRITATDEILLCVPADNAVRVRIHEHMLVWLPPQDPLQDRSPTIIDTQADDVWVQLDGRWKLQRTTITKQTVVPGSNS